MRTFAQKPQANQPATAADLVTRARARGGQNANVKAILQSADTMETHAVPRLRHANMDERFVASPTEHDDGRIGAQPYTTRLAQIKRGETSVSGRTIVPGSVHDVLRSSGQPLNSVTQHLMEARFGHEFGQVRVHTDSKAAASAQDLNARAYTVGPHIVFGADRFRTGTRAGLHLLSHELTHVLQQRRASVRAAHDISNDGDFHERQARVVADRFITGAAVTGVIDAGAAPAVPLLQRDTHQSTPSGTTPPTTTAAPPPLRPLDYDLRPVQLPLVEAGHTAAVITKLLDGKVKTGDITAYSVKGVTSGSSEEIFLLAAIYYLGKRSRWGSEADIVTAIGWPAKRGDPAPLGRVTVRIDAHGAASAELIAAGAVPAVAQMTFAAGSAKLIADFGYASVTGWSNRNPTKDAAEISDIVAAMELLKSRAPQDVLALKGVQLIRVPSLGGLTAGQFSIGGEPSPGGTSGGKPWLKLADRAFGETAQFSGGGPGAPTLPASFQIILHEVGHAVEKEELRIATEAYMEASADVEAARKLLKGDPAAYDAALQEAKRKGKLSEFYKKQAATYKKLEQAEQTASKRQREAAGKLEQTKVAAPVIKPFETEAAALKTAATDASNAAKNTLPTLRPDEVQTSAAYVKAIDDTAAAIVAFAVDAKIGRGLIEDLELIVFQKVYDRDKAHFTLLRIQNPRGGTHRAVFVFGRAVQSQDAWFDAERLLARVRQRTRRLQTFIDIVTANNIRRFTQYSVQNWRLAPAEFYAEAYSLWLVDPVFLKNNYKAVYDFFQNGDYRK